jgi:hypothetical protein
VGSQPGPRAGKLLSLAALAAECAPAKALGQADVSATNARLRAHNVDVDAI